MKALHGALSAEEGECKTNKAQEVRGKTYSVRGIAKSLEPEKQVREEKAMSEW